MIAPVAFTPKYYEVSIPEYVEDISMVGESPSSCAALAAADYLQATFSLLDVFDPPRGQHCAIDAIVRGKGFAYYLARDLKRASEIEVI